MKATLLFIIYCLVLQSCCTHYGSEEHTPDKYRYFISSRSGTDTIESIYYPQTGATFEINSLNSEIYLSNHENTLIVVKLKHNLVVDTLIFQTSYQLKYSAGNECATHQITREGFSPGLLFHTFKKIVPYQESTTSNYSYTSYNINYGFEN